MIHARSAAAKYPGKSAASIGRDFGMNSACRHIAKPSKQSLDSKKQYAIIRAKEERLALRLCLDAAVAKEENARDDLRLAEKAWSKWV